MSLIELWDVLIKPKSAPPLCSDCKYSVKSPLTGTLYCKSPYVDPVGGDADALDVMCGSSRRYFCKNHGRYFEPKQAPNTGREE